jgi:hypothetical protein
VDPTVTVMVVVICTQLARLGSLALWLRSGARRHQLEVLATLSARLAPDVLVELDVRHGPDGRLRLRTSTQPFGQEPHVRA